MPTALQISFEETEALNYERYYYPCPVVQKRLHAMYVKATLNLSNEMTGTIAGAHRNSIASWIKTYLHGGMEAPV